MFALPAVTPVASWVPDSTVTAVVGERGGRTLIGGSFARLGPPLGRAILVDAAAGGVVGRLPGVAGGDVLAAVPDGHGGVYLGGRFSRVGGLPRTGLAHVRADGTVDPAFAPVLRVAAGPAPGGGVVGALALVGPTLYVGGSFGAVGGAPRADLAAVDAASGAVESGFAPDPDGPVTALVPGPGGSLFVAGGFARVAGHSRISVAAVDGTSGSLLPFDPAPHGGVATLALAGGTLYAGGSFDAIGRATRTNLAALDPVTGDAQPWAPEAGIPVTALVVDGNAVLAASGYGPLFGGAAERRTAAPSAPPQPGVEAISRSAGADVIWRRTLPFSGATTLHAEGGRVYAGGSFVRIGAQPRAGAVALREADGALLPWDPRLLGVGQPDVTAIVPTARGLLLTGGFASARGVARSGLAEFDRAGRPTAWRPLARGRVEVLAAGGGRTFVFGSFSRIAGRARGGAAAFGTRHRLLAWRAPRRVGPFVTSAVVAGGRVFLNGPFPSIRVGKQVASVIALDASTGRLVARYGRRLATTRDLLSTPAGMLALGQGTATFLDPRTGARRAAPIHIKGFLSAAAVDGDRVYLSGGLSVNGATRRLVVAVDARSGRVLPFTVGGRSFYAPALAADHGVVYIAVYDGSGLTVTAHAGRSGRALGWRVTAPQQSFYPRLAVPHPGELAVYGNFSDIADRQQPILALFRR